MCNFKIARFSKFLSGGRDNGMSILDGILYWVLLSHFGHWALNTPSVTMTTKNMPSTPKHH